MRLAVALIICLLPSCLYAQDRPLTRIILNDGKVINTDVVYEDYASMLIKQDGQSVWIKKSDVKAIIKLPPCPLTLEQVPELRGFRLGQSIAEVSKRFPTVKPLSTTKDVSASVIEITPKDIAERPEFNGVLGARLIFLDSKLVVVTAYYESLTKWTDSQFRDAVASGLNLQATGWTQSPEVYSLRCDGFIVRTVVTNSGNSVRIEKEGLSEELQRRIDTIQAETRKMFKP